MNVPREEAALLSPSEPDGGHSRGAVTALPGLDLSLLPPSLMVCGGAGEAGEGMEAGSGLLLRLQ